MHDFRAFLLVTFGISLILPLGMVTEFRLYYVYQLVTLTCVVVVLC